MSLAAVGQTYPRELALTLAVPLTGVQRAVNALQRQGALSSRIVGRVRILELNPTWYAARELRALLDRMAEANPEEIAGPLAVRRRPRRAGKPL
ncbi:MAG: hypothetical protein NVSMB64_24880 [Candidatus Velthaea sp.]